jgi:hypothetical protein
MRKRRLLVAGVVTADEIDDRCLSFVYMDLDHLGYL